MPVGRICRCGRLTTGSCCPTRRPNRRIPGSLQRKVYDSAAWQRTRRIVLARDGFTCRGCGFFSPDGSGLVADHIVPLVDLVAVGGDPLDPDECQTLCRSCSGAKDGVRARPRRA